MNKARRNSLFGRLRVVFATAPALLPFNHVVARCAGLGHASHVLEILQRMERAGEVEQYQGCWGRPGVMKGAA
jgi:hypothetical protein